MIISQVTRKQRRFKHVFKSFQVYPTIIQHLQLTNLDHSANQRTNLVESTNN